MQARRQRGADWPGGWASDLNEFGFAQTDRLAPLATSRPGLYVAGAFQEPKDIPESVAQAIGRRRLRHGAAGRGRGTLIQRHEYPWERDVTDEAPRVGVFICHCGHNIASVIDVEAVAEQAATLPNVVPRRGQPLHLLRHQPAAHQGHDPGAPAQPRWWWPPARRARTRSLFQETLRESGLNQYLFAMTNIRDQCSWVHKDDPVAATRQGRGPDVAWPSPARRHLQGAADRASCR